MKIIILILALFLCPNLTAQDYQPDSNIVSIFNVGLNNNNLDLSYGDKGLSLNLSIGKSWKLGLLCIQKWTYSGFNYVLTVTDEGEINHGLEIVLGFNCFLDKNETVKIQIGGSVSSNDLGLEFRPLIVGLSFNLLSKYK